MTYLERQKIQVIVETVFDEAQKQFKETVKTIEGYGVNIIGRTIVETKSNSVDCHKMINLVKEMVKQKYSDVFVVTYERRDLEEDELLEDEKEEFGDIIAFLEIGLSWAEYAKRQELRIIAR